MLLTSATVAALRADYTAPDPGREASDPRLVQLLDSYEHLRALRDAVSAILPDLRSSEDGACTVCGEAETCTPDCTAAPLRVAYVLVSPRRVQGRPAGQRVEVAGG